MDKEQRLSLSTLVLVACSACGQATIDVDPGPPPAVVPSLSVPVVEAPVRRDDPEGLVAGAMARWGAATGLTFEDLPAFVVERPEVVTCNGAPAIGCATYPKAGQPYTLIEVEAGAWGLELELIVEHEVGHMLGASHDGGGIMRATLNIPGGITSTTLEEVCATHPCLHMAPEE